MWTVQTTGEKAGVRAAAGEEVAAGVGAVGGADGRSGSKIRSLRVSR